VKVRLAVLIVLAAALTGGCDTRESICPADSYPVIHVNGTGRSCVKKSEEPSPGFTRFPRGQAPQYVDDDWDKYWRNHTVDDKGNIVTVA
jgi:hypothetical protein